MVKRKEILEKFGKEALERGLFYKQEGSLRFELSGNGTYIDMFCRAMDRSREILNFLFADTENLTIVLSYFGSTTLIRERKIFRSIKNCGIVLPKAIEISSIIIDSQERVFLVFDDEKSTLQRLLWGIFANELGIKPNLLCKLYIVDIKLGVLAHPYDDRGMDIVGFNKSLLKQLFISFNHYLLDYDRKTMESFFGI